MRFQILLLAALLALPIPAVASPATEQSQGDVVASELAGFGRWLVRLNAIHEPVQENLGAFRGHWARFEATGYRQGGAEFRAAVAQTLTVIRQAEAGVEALDAPDFAALEMPEDVRTASLRRDLIRTYRELHNAMSQFVPVATALERGDAGAAATAGRRLFEGLRIVLDTQVSLRRAAMSATPREEAAWEVTNLEYLFARTASRLFKGLHEQMEGRTDRALAADLRALAGEFETTAEQGSEKLEAQYASFGEAAEGLERSGDRAGLDVVRRAQRVYASLRPAFPLARRVAGTLREAAGGPLPLARINALFLALQPYRQELDALARAESEALAAPIQ
jgi:hypothetical protein